MENEFDSTEVRLQAIYQRRAALDAQSEMARKGSYQKPKPKKLWHILPTNFLGWCEFAVRLYLLTFVLGVAGLPFIVVLGATTFLFPRHVWHATKWVGRETLGLGLALGLGGIAVGKMGKEQIAKKWTSRKLSGDEENQLGPQGTEIPSVGQVELPSLNEMGKVTLAKTDIPSGERLDLHLMEMQKEKVDQGVFPDWVTLREERTSLEQVRPAKTASSPKVTEKVVLKSQPVNWDGIFKNKMEYDQEISQSGLGSGSKPGFRLRVFAGAERPVIIWSSVEGGTDFADSAVSKEASRKGLEVLNSLGYPNANPRLFEHLITTSSNSRKVSFSEVEFDEKEAPVARRISKGEVEAACGEKLLRDPSKNEEVKGMEVD